MRERILQAAIQNIKNYGFRRFTIDDITADLGISKKTVYKYFSSKNQLISELVEQTIQLEEETTAREMALHDHWLDKLMVQMTVYSYNNIPFRLLDELYRCFPAEGAKVNALIKRRQELYRELITAGIEKGDIRTGIDPDIIILILNKLFTAPAEEDFLLNSDLSINQLLKQMQEVVLYGILINSPTMGGSAQNSL